MLDDILVTNRAWHTRDIERGTGTYAIVAANKYRAGHDLVAQEIAQIFTDIGLLIK